MKDPVQLIIFVSVMAFVGWVFIAETPLDRLDHTCRPVHWLGTATSSLVSVVSTSGEEKVNEFFESGVHHCKMIAWKQFYESRFNEMKVEKEKEAKLKELSEKK